MAEPIVRRALVTGANRGLGLEFVRQLLARGDRVIATCRQPAQAHDLATLSDQDSKTAHPEPAEGRGVAGRHAKRLHVFAADIADANSVAMLARDTGAVFDGLDLLINNAGMLVPGEKFGSVNPESLRSSLATNAIGPFLLTQALAPLLAKGDRAIVANISSQLGSIARTDSFYTPSYAISKAAQNMASVLLAHALAEQGVRVLALHPGWVHTDMGGERAPVSPAESVRGLLDVIDQADTSRSAHFLDYQGQPLPW